jgi:hypothetical protein
MEPIERQLNTKCLGMQFNYRDDLRMLDLCLDCGDELVNFPVVIVKRGQQ